MLCSHCGKSMKNTKVKFRKFMRHGVVGMAPTCHDCYMSWAI